jgi:hypothetical protein
MEFTVGEPGEISSTSNSLSAIQHTAVLAAGALSLQPNLALRVTTMAGVRNISVRIYVVELPIISPAPERHTMKAFEVGSPARDGGEWPDSPSGCFNLYRLEIEFSST